jgi:hypothetical protein
MKVRITEAELARDVRAALAKVEQGDEVIIEREDHRAIAVIKPPEGGRLISECIALAEKYEREHGAATLDEDFAKDVQAGIDSHRVPWNPPSWD